MKAILDYRTAEAAKAQHNVDATKMSEGMVRLWEEMARATVEARQKREEAHGRRRNAERSASGKG